MSFSAKMEPIPNPQLAAASTPADSLQAIARLAVLICGADCAALGRAAPGKISIDVVSAQCRSLRPINCAAYGVDPAAFSLERWTIPPLRGNQLFARAESCSIRWSAIRRILSAFSATRAWRSRAVLKRHSNFLAKQLHCWNIGQLEMTAQRC